MDMPIQFYSAMGAIVAALIAGFLSLLSLVTSKDQKLSELRHEWISEFRKELSELVAEVRYSKFWVERFLEDSRNHGKNPYVQDTYKSSFLAISKSVSSLGLRVNPDVSDKKLRTLNTVFLEKLKNLKIGYSEATATDAEILSDELRDAARPILQSEWQYIEKGEVGHRILKIVAALVLVLGLFGVVAVVDTKFTNIAPTPPTPIIQP